MKLAEVDWISSVPFDQTVQWEHLSWTVVKSCVTFCERTVTCEPLYIGGRECPLPINLSVVKEDIHSKPGGYNDFLIIGPSNQHQCPSHFRTESCCEPFCRTWSLQGNKQVWIARRSRNRRDIQGNTDFFGRTKLCLWINRCHYKISRRQRKRMYGRLEVPDGSKRLSCWL